MAKQITLKVEKQGDVFEVKALKGDNLRKVLLKNNLSPYSKLNHNLNCMGNGICATCGVFVKGNQPKPKHWHDKLAANFYYPRLSCQITIEEDLEIEIPPKLIWGSRRKPK